MLVGWWRDTFPVRSVARLNGTDSGSLDGFASRVMDWLDERISEVRIGLNRGGVSPLGQGKASTTASPSLWF